MSQKMSRKSQFSISPIAAAVSAALVPGAVLAQVESTDGKLDEMIVTATKTEQDLQKIPKSVQAIPEAMLRDMGALKTEDYTRFMPAVNWINLNSGGNNQVIFRGVHTSVFAFTMTRSSSVYLDEIPITATNGDSPDIRMMDVSRVEALSGPQGTLFGAAAQSGTLRIITNQPDTSKFEASADVSFFTGEESDASHSVTGVLNLPLIEDKFAIRIAAQSAKDGGYIDNIAGHQPDTWFGETAAENAAGGTAAPRAWGYKALEWGRGTNADVVEENWNSADITNFRIAARWEITEAVAATVAYHYGETDSQGSAAYNPFVGDLQTIMFAKDTSESEWDMLALTIEADLGFAQFVSATSFYENQRTYVIDNTLYYHYYTTKGYCADNGVWADKGAPPTYVYYWLWENTQNGRAIYAPIYCQHPTTNPTGAIDQIPDMVGIGLGPEWQERFSQEFRLSHQGERFDWLAGLYYEDSKDEWNSVWLESANTPYQDTTSYAFLKDCASGEGAIQDSWTCRETGQFGVLRTPGGADAINAALATADHYWDSRDTTDWTTKAVFGEFTWHVTARLNMTIGGRWFETENDKLYIKQIAGTTDSNDRHVGGFLQPNWIGSDVVQSAKLDEFVPKVSIDYALSDSKMMYGLYSEGYRVGGINRANKNADWSRTLWGQTFEPDKLRNYEIGLRSRWADDTVQLNLTGFYMDWSDFQHEVVDPSGGECIIPAEEPTCDSGQLPWISIVGNVGDAHNTGLQAEVDWVPSERWNVGANAMWLEAEIDSVTTDEMGGLEPGQELPNSPDLQGALWATYTWPVRFVPGGAEMFVRGQYSYTGDTLSRIELDDETTRNPQFTNDAYAIGDIRFGLVSGDGTWEVNLFVNNVTDERAQVQQGNRQYTWQWGNSSEYSNSHNVYTVRPREYGLRFFTRWGGD